MNLPNSGWKCGGSSPSLTVVRYTSTCRKLNHNSLVPSFTALAGTGLPQLLVSGKRLQDLSLG
jgi:hypothetical protein